MRTFLTLVLVLALLRCSDVGYAQESRVYRDIVYKTGNLSDYERTRCKLDLYLPVDEQEEFATLVWFHGGSLTSGDKRGPIAMIVADRFTGEGIAVASVNYRLSPQASFPAYIEDAAAAVAFVRAEIAKYGGSAKRLLVSGHSAGGYLAAMVGADPSYLGKHGLHVQDLAGVVPIAGQMITHSTVRYERGIPKTRPIIDEAAPCYHVSPTCPTFLNIVGSEDLPARAAENHYFVAAMRAADHRKTTYLEVEGRNHLTIVSQIAEADDVVAQAIVNLARRSTPANQSAENKR